MSRRKDLKRFYKLMNTLKKKTGGRRKLGDCDPTTDPKIGGVYFFFEKGERRTGSGKGKRVVRVGKCQRYRHRISRQHKGPRDEMVRGSVFRRWIHNALFLRDRKRVFAGFPDITQMNLTGMLKALNRGQQRRLAKATSEHMWPMDFLFVPIRGEECRRYIEKNAIALLSEYNKKAIDPASKGWLGRHSASERIKRSGLWNNNHVANAYEPEFIDRLEEYADQACD